MKSCWEVIVGYCKVGKKLRDSNSCKMHIMPSRVLTAFHSIYIYIYMSLLPSSDVSTRLICVCMAFSLRIFLCSDRFEIEHKTQKVVWVSSCRPNGSAGQNDWNVAQWTSFFRACSKEWASAVHKWLWKWCGLSTVYLLYIYWLIVKSEVARCLCRSPASHRTFHLWAVRMCTERGNRQTSCFTVHLNLRQCL